MEDRRSVHILVVNPDRTVCEGIKKALEDAGYWWVFTAGRTAEAVKAFEGVIRYNLVVTALHLRGPDDPPPPEGMADLSGLRIYREAQERRITALLYQPDPPPEISGFEVAESILEVVGKATEFLSQH